MIQDELDVLKKILKELHFVDDYIDLLIKHIRKQFNSSSLTEITPHFVYAVLAFEIGRNNARTVSEDFEDYKKTGKYRSRVDRFLDNYKFKN